MPGLGRERAVSRGCILLLMRFSEKESRKSNFLERKEVNYGYGKFVERRMLESGTLFRGS